jgi:putative oxidoreductase
VTVATVPASPEGRAFGRSFPAQDAVAVAGRVLIAAIFVMSGLGKIAQPGATIGYMTSVGLPLAPLGLAGSVLIEAVGGLALILGYRTRFVAAVLAAFAIVTALIFHSAFSDQNQFIHFFKNVAVAGGLLQVVAFGGGRLSLDARLSRND